MTTLAETLDALLDPGSVEPIAVPLRAASGEYAASLERAAQRSGVDESVQVMVAAVDGHRVLVIASEFGFLAGSVGHSAADRVVEGYRRATAERLPVITLPTSGGTRMQEGAAAFFRMIDIARAAHEHLACGAVRIGWLRNPTTGGVKATWGSYADVTAGEPGALLGFLGPKVFEALHDEAFPPVQTAENLARVGVIDQVIALQDLRAWVTRILSVTDGVDAAESIGSPLPVGEVDAWDAITLTRDAARPGPEAVLDLLTDRTELHGTHTGETGTGVRVALGRIRGRRAVVVAQTRRSVSPQDLRLAQRGLRLARAGRPAGGDDRRHARWRALGPGRGGRDGRRDREDLADAGRPERPDRVLRDGAGLRWGRIGTDPRAHCDLHGERLGVAVAPRGGVGHQP